MARIRQPLQIDADSLPLSISARRSVPAYLQLAQQLQALISSRALRIGARLPSSRVLANTLGINRNTVVAAFEHLINVGAVETRGRGGTIVVDLPGQHLRGAQRSSALGPSAPKRSRLSAGQSALIDFRLGSADPTPLRSEVWRRACREAGRQLPPADYGDPQGDSHLRAQVALYLGRTRAMRVEPDQIVITAGTGQSVERVAEVFLRRNDVAAMEEPGYPRAARAFGQAGARLMPIAVDEDGIDTTALRATRQAPRLLHVTPAHQYPMGARLSSARRHELIQWARQNAALIVENDYDGEFRYSSPPLPSLAALSSFDHVAYLGTFSKVLSPSIRLAYIAGRADLIQSVAARILQAREPVSIVTQRIVCWLIRSGELERHVRRARRQYVARRDAMIKALAEVPAVEAVLGQAAGLHVVVKLRRDAAIACSDIRLERTGIAVNRAADYYLRDGKDDRLLLAYGHLTEAQIAEGVGRLHTLIRARGS
jgi:GntR family transcriptional regulator/MocR family aminotransferase